MMTTADRPLCAFCERERVEHKFDPYCSKECRQKQADKEEALALQGRLARRAIPKRPAVVVFGRFNPPTTGHAKLFSFLVQEASRLKATPIVFPSVTQDKKNPLPFVEKVRFLRQLFPGLPISRNAKIRTPFDVLATLSLMGFDAVWFVVGSDQTREFESFGKYIKPKGVRDGRNIILKQFGVLTVPDIRDPNVAGTAGMSGTKLRSAVAANKWLDFRAGIPTKNDRLARQIFDSVRRHMGLTESKGVVEKLKPVFLLYGTSKAAAWALQESFEKTIRPAHPTVQFFNVSGRSAVDIKQFHRTLKEHGYTPTIYVKEAALPRVVNESWMKTQTTCGELRRWNQNLIVLGKHGILEMVTHVETVLEAEGQAPKPKETSEVQRLQVQQKQEELLTKKRQSDQMLQAKQRELSKKSREQQQKLTKPKTGA